MKNPLYINILWHMHQPYYEDVLSNEFILPWVRLHCTKDYLQMALLIEESENIKMTINFAPSLILQINQIIENPEKDIYFKLSMIEPDNLSNDQKFFILDNFFKCNENTMIKRFPRYLDLYNKRGKIVNDKILKDAVKIFSKQDFLDLQVYYNLAWITPMLWEKDEFLKKIIKTQWNFNQQTKVEFLNYTIELVKQVIPLYKKLYSQKKIEISFTPFYHPILPILCEPSDAKVCAPEIILPENIIDFTEFADEQVREGKAYIESIFGEVNGCWPSEGSVSEKAISILEKNNVLWAATSEGILFNSTIENHNQRYNDYNHKNIILNKPYRMKDRNICLFFRDHQISDLLGFVYSKWEPGAAAADFIERLENIYSLSDKSKANVLSIILDGENAWEFYENNGIDFLRGIYKELGTNENLSTITPSEYLKKFMAQEKIEKLFPGSWINSNFNIWIGHREDNTAWEFIYEAYRLMQKKKDKLSEIDYKRCIELIKIAQGSDWFWWYGDDHSTIDDKIFDELFRKIIIKIYNICGVDCPIKLNQPIKKQKKIVAFTQAIRFLNPVIDGEDTTYFEWLNAGKFEVGSSATTMHKTDYLIKAIYWGFNLESLFFRIDFNKQKISSNLKVRIAIIKTEKDIKNIDIDLSEKSKFNQDYEYCYKKILEVKINYEYLQIRENEEINIYFKLIKGKEEIENWPMGYPLKITIPDETFEGRYWNV